jgi:hypothetical protein
MPYADICVIIILHSQNSKISILISDLGLQIIRVKELFVHGHLVNALLRELECGEEDGVDDAGA